MSDLNKKSEDNKTEPSDQSVGSLSNEPKISPSSSNQNLQDFLREAVASSIWVPNPVSLEPETVLTRWTVYQVAGKGSEKATIHFVGLASSYFEGRVSSPILSFDEVEMEGISRSGRVYKLEGKPGTHPDAQYVWKSWLQINGNPDYMDVSQKFKGDLE